MLMPGTPEMIQVRIVELVARRNAMAAFCMNQRLLQEAGILDQQIRQLRKILEDDSVPAINDELLEWPRWDDEGNRTDNGLRSIK